MEKTVGSIGHEEVSAIKPQAFAIGRRSPTLFVFVIGFVLLTSAFAFSQVGFDATTSANGQLTAGANTLSFTHTSTGSNLVLVVGVSMNITARTTTTVSSVTYNGAALTSAGSVTGSNARRTEIWYLANPSTGAHTVVVTLNIPGTGTVGTVAGATTFTGADQNTPIRTFASNTGTNTNAAVTVTSSSNDMVLETLAAAGGTTATLTSSAQVQQWSISSGTGNRDVYGFGSTRAGSASVPMSETLSAAAAWADAAVSIQASQSDSSIQVSGSTTHYPANVSYTITVKNTGPSTASGATVSFTLPTGLTLLSVTPSQGSCTGTTSISCSLGTLAADATATVTVTATPSVPGGYPLSATLTLTSADLNSANNSASGVAYSSFTDCASTTTTAGGNLTGIINTYYPGTATATAGSTSITLGAGTGASTAIAAGDLVLVIQMQDAAINTANSSQYGDGVSGRGATSLNNSGLYEYATATSNVPLTGGTLSLSAAGPGGGLLYTYTSAAASSTQGARTFQVIRVPNYASATLTSGLTASGWNGSTGGVLALNVSGTLTLNGATVSVSGLGFRGAGGLQLNGGATGATNSDYLFTAPASYTTGGAPLNGAHGSKGEGIAGTPEYVESGGTVVSTNQTYAEGYPNGSMARGAPGNAGGGGTDGDPATAAPNGNDENSGGGGGANGGAGGQGGNTWNSNLSIGGLGGAAFPASSTRVVLGGGGGGGSRNNSDGDTQASSGGAGGGMVFIRAATITGSATINASGSAAYNATANDGGGGGGGGGSIVVLWGAVSGGTPTLTLTATGGRGGDAWDAGTFNNANRHGPGGGGGGGAILYTGTGATVTPSVSGGLSGITLNNASTTYGASGGSSGVSSAGITLDASAGPRSSSSVCSDVSITKTGSPSPVIVNNTLTYTISVKNNSTTNAATNLKVVDTLPSQVTYGSYSISGGTGGTCTQSAGVLTCSFSSLAASATATITVVTTAATPYTLSVNTAIINSETADPNPVNNTATVSVAIEGPTSVRVNSFSASRSGSDVVLSWNTGGELHNLGFNVYRESGGGKVLLNPSLIAGSALLMREALEQHAAKTYAWKDPAPSYGGTYWLEDVDLNGTRTLHGPIEVQSTAAPTASTARASTIRELAARTAIPNSGITATSATSHVRERVARPVMTPVAQNVGFDLAGRAGVKILVDHEGWYRVTQPQLVAAGLNPHLPSNSLHLFAEGVEQAIRTTGADGEFGAESAIEFYGTAIDTPYSGQRVYWLASMGGPGQRVASESGSGSAGRPVSSFWQTLELKPRTTYFAALLREDTDNFFGPLSSDTTTAQSLTVANLAAGPVVIDVTLQGVTGGQQHDVTVSLNGSPVGDVTFADQNEGKARFTVPEGVLTNGANTLTFTAQQGANDLSLIDYVDVTYPHSYTAESDQLKFTAAAGSAVSVTGFTSPPTRVADVTDPLHPALLSFATSRAGSGYALSTQIPWTGSGQHTLIALADTRLQNPGAIVQHAPSKLHAVQNGAEMVMLTAPQFLSQVAPLAQLRRAEAKSVVLITVDEVYDEFNFGERTPYAIREFLRTASSAWRVKPHYLVLGGDASVDPRNYLGFGFLDLVPTKIVVTSELKTASDDWFSDFEGTGVGQIATGRLPARTPDEAGSMINKVLRYGRGPAGSWTKQAMVVADVDDPSLSFSQASQTIQKLLPQSMNVTGVFAGTLGAGTARQQIVDGINSGQLFVNYNGHGSVQIWGSNLFDDTAASTLSNGNRLPFVVAMNCLNGFFHDVYTESLATALMLANDGGAVAVWASSGLTPPAPQVQMDQTFVKTLFFTPGISVGDAVLRAKSGIADQDVRRTFILFGDPSMKLRTETMLPGTGTNTGGSESGDCRTGRGCSFGAGPSGITSQTRPQPRSIDRERGE